MSLSSNSAPSATSNRPDPKLHEKKDREEELHPQKQVSGEKNGQNADEQKQNEQKQNEQNELREAATEHKDIEKGGPNLVEAKQKEQLEQGQIKKRDKSQQGVEQKPLEITPSVVTTTIEAVLDEQSASSIPYSAAPPSSLPIAIEKLADQDSTVLSSPANVPPTAPLASTSVQETKELPRHRSTQIERKSKRASKKIKQRSDRRQVGKAQDLLLSHSDLAQQRSVPNLKVPFWVSTLLHHLMR